LTNGSNGSGGANGKLPKVLQLATLGISIPAAIAIGAAIGYFLDGFFGTFPWLSAVFFFFGVGAAFLNLFRVLKKFDEP